jgi:UDP-N-acetylmuramoyl-L-alanyl-D-glutamate--2,6-diaminopimelate ligase
MKPAKLKDVLKSAGAFRVLQGSEDVLINSIEETASEVKPGALFVCVKGLSADGHDFAQDAAGRGAAAVLASRPVKLKGGATVACVKTPRKRFIK